MQGPMVMPAFLTVIITGILRQGSIQHNVGLLATFP